MISAIQPPQNMKKLTRNISALRCERMTKKDTGVISPGAFATSRVAACGARADDLVNPQQQRQTELRHHPKESVWNKSKWWY